MVRSNKVKYRPSLGLTSKVGVAVSVVAVYPVSLLFLVIYFNSMTGTGVGMSMPGVPLFLFVVITAVLVSRLIVIKLIKRPLANLEAGMERVAVGNFAVPVPVTTPDEMGLLARSFNTMASHLSHLVQSMCDGVRTLVNSSERIREALGSGRSQQEGLLAGLQHIADGMDRGIGILKAGLACQQHLREGHETIGVALRQLGSVNTEMLASIRTLQRVQREASEGLETINGSLSTTKSRMLYWWEESCQLADEMSEFAQMVEDLTLLVVTDPPERCAEREANLREQESQRLLFELEELVRSKTAMLTRNLRRSVQQVGELVELMDGVWHATGKYTQVLEMQDIELERSFNQARAIGDVLSGLVQDVEKNAAVNNQLGKMMEEMEKILLAEGTLSQQQMEAWQKSHQIIHSLVNETGKLIRTAEGLEILVNQFQVQARLEDGAVLSPGMDGRLNALDTSWLAGGKCSA